MFIEYHVLVVGQYQEGLGVVSTMSPHLLYHQPPPYITAQLYAYVSLSTSSVENFNP